MGVELEDKKDGTTVEGEAMSATAHPDHRAAAVPAGGRAAAGGNLPRQHRGTDRRRLQRSPARGLGRGGRRRGGVRRAAGRAADADRHHGRLAGRLRVAQGAGRDRHALRASGGGRAGRRHHAGRRAGEARGRARRRQADGGRQRQRASISSSKRGFVAQTRNTVPLGGEWLANTTMEKKLAAKEKAP